MKIITSAPNKLILCGEHFVVYGAPSLAIPTDNRNKVILTSYTGEKIIKLRSDLGKAEYINGIFSGNNVFQPFIPLINRILDKNITETIEIEIVSSGAPKGMGSSSSIGAALGLALSTYFGKNISDNDLFEFGQIVDEMAHGGKPSGIDAKTTSMGKPIKFQKLFNPVKFIFEEINIELPNGTTLIVVDTFKNERESTGNLIEKFAKANKITKKPNELTEEERRELFERYMLIFQKFIKNCNKNGDPKILGDAFNENQELLSSVSTPEIEEVIKIALKNRALGAKISGAGGRGGAVIILAFEKEKNNIIKKLKQINYNAFEVKIAKSGAIVEYKGD